MSDSESSRQQDIQTVLTERESMRKVGQKIITLIDSGPNHEKKPDKVLVRQTIQKFVEHFANIGSFCDRGTQNWIQRMQLALIGYSIRLDYASNLIIYTMMTMAIGVQLDFSKRPFRVIGLEVLKGQFKVLLKK